MRKFIEKESQINWLDERYYLIKDEYYPSATFILDSYPKGAAFAEFLKMAGQQAKYIADKAADAGSRVHKAIEYLSIGMEIVWDDKINDESEWSAICKFKEFYDIHKVKVLNTEVIVYSEKYKYAGTIDLICEIEGETWLIDHKFAKGIYSSAWLQIAAYKSAWQEMGNFNIDRMGVLWLKALTRGPAKDKIQGLGWQLKEPVKEYEHLFNIFLATQKLHNEEHSEAKPKNRIYPNKLNLNKDEKTID